MNVRSGCRICESILILFALFVKIKSLELSQTRYTFPLKGLNMDILMQKVLNDANNDLKNEVGIVFRGQEIKEATKTWKDAKILFEVLESNLSTMEKMFTDVVYNYTTKMVWKYCKAVLGLINNKSEPNITNKDILKYNLDKSNEYYYVIAFLHGYNYYVNGILETLFFFQTWPYTISNSEEQTDHEKFTKDSMQKKITEFMNDLQLVGQSKFEDNSEITVNNLIFQRVIVKVDLSNFVKRFIMDPIKPIVNKYLYIPKENIYDGEINRDFSNFIYANETCILTVSLTYKLIIYIGGQQHYYSPRPYFY